MELPFLSPQHLPKSVRNLFLMTYAAWLIVQALVLPPIDCSGSLPAGLPACVHRPLCLQNSAAHRIYSQPSKHSAYGAEGGTEPYQVQSVIKPFSHAGTLRPVYLLSPCPSVLKETLLSLVSLRHSGPWWSTFICNLLNA